jgi:alkylation response protein AidB-like acyl-CoA dehydrogenase
MDLRDTAAQAAFRTELRGWLRRNLPTEPDPADMTARFDYIRDWQRKLHDGGWIALSWPVEYGGRGLSEVEESIFNQELSRAAAPPSLPLIHLARPFLTHGTEEQRRQYLPDLLSADVIWCQGFSEPGAGSDLASLRTVARADGDTFVITGQKVWTSFAAYAEMCLLLARTDESVPKHKGISAFLMPLKTEGVSVRPILMANGDQEFGEVFLDEVRIPAANMLGKPGDGWAIALSTISHERGAADIGYQAKFERYFSELLSESLEAGLLEDPVAQVALGRARVELEVFGMHCLRRLSERADGRDPGPLSSIDKLLMTKVEQTLLQVAVSNDPGLSAERSQAWFDRYVYARAGSIYGGTAQIQKNILANRVLGLNVKKS